MLTAGIFLPAFVFPLLAHEPLDRLLHEPRIRELLDGLTAAVAGLIAGITVALLVTSVKDGYAAAVFVVALAMLFYSKHTLTVPLVVAGAAAAGAIAMSID